MGGDIIREYDDMTRGTFQSVECAKQLVSFEGMVYRGRSGAMSVTPTDIDGLIQLDAENCVVLFELKHHGGMPDGQKQAYVKLCDAVEKGGMHCIIINAVHNTETPNIIMAKNAIVNEYYHRGQWFYRDDDIKLSTVINKYLTWAKEH